MSHGQAPTSKQLAYLRVLADQTGTTFAAPRDRRAASREIDRLRELKRDNGMYLEAPSETPTEGTYATAAHPSEIEGWGASAKWRTSARRTKHATGRAGDRQGAQGEEDGPRARPRRLASYMDARGEAREIIALTLSHGTLVIDRLTGSGYDPRLVGHLRVDEPADNARLLARMYVGDGRRGRCRPVTDADLTPTRGEDELSRSAAVQWQAPLVAGIGVLLQIRSVRQDRGGTLRWTITTRRATAPHVLPLRNVFGLLQAYEPAVSMTRAAIAAQAEDAGASAGVLRGELQRACSSPIVLNRALRERVEHAIATEGLSMSEIAIRCNRVKRDSRGRESGETSWLARRIGQLPEAGKQQPTSWIHTDVLALIARDGLGINPCEAEVPHGDR